MDSKWYEVRLAFPVASEGEADALIDAACELICGGHTVVASECPHCEGTGTVGDAPCEHHVCERDFVASGKYIANFGEIDEYVTCPSCKEAVLASQIEDSGETALEEALQDDVIDTAIEEG